MAPAKTGSDNNKSRAVIATAHTNKGIRSGRNLLERMLITVVMKLIAPKIEDTPAKWREKMARSTDGPECARYLERGGYTVHPVPTPFPTIADETRRINDGGSNQNLILFIRGKAISGAESISGTNQLPNPPIKTGITKKKIIKNACAVTIVL